MRSVLENNEGMLFKNKRGQLTLQSIIIGLVIIGVVIAAAFLILGELLTETIAEGNADAIEGVNKTIQAMKKIATFLGIIVLVAILVIVINYLGILQPRSRGAADF